MPTKAQNIVFGIALADALLLHFGITPKIVAKNLSQMDNASPLGHLLLDTSTAPKPKKSKVKTKKDSKI